MGDNPNVNTTKKDDKKDKKPEKKKKKPASKAKMDKTSMIFYIILLVGLIAFVIVMIINNKKQHYTAYFDEKLKVTIDLKGDDFILSIYADSDTPSIQEGKFKEKKDEDNSSETTEKASNTNAKSKTYVVTFDDESTAEFTIDEEKGILLFKKPEYTIEFRKGDFDYGKTNK